MIQRKNDVVSQTCAGVKFLMDKNDIDVYHGMGSFHDKNTVVIKEKSGEKKIKGKNIIIATGSKPNYFPGMEPDKKRIITSTEALRQLFQHWMEPCQKNSLRFSRKKDLKSIRNTRYKR